MDDLIKTKDGRIYEKEKPKINEINENNKNAPKTKYRVMLCATYYKLYSGYARVVYELLRRLVKKEPDTLELTLFAFQNSQQNSVHRDTIENLTVYDAFENEDPKRNGFGEKEIGTYLIKHPQDLVIIYNDMSIVSLLTKDIIETVPEEQRKSMQLWCYIDQVYQYQKEQYICVLNQCFKGIIAFSTYWADFIKTQVRSDMPVEILPHGIDTQCYYPIPKHICRLYFSIPNDAFVIGNLNRNQPRKMWSHTCMAFAELVKKHQDLIKANPSKKYKPLKLLVGTALQGVWNIPEVLSWEFKRRNLDPNLINSYITAVARPQQLTDREVNILYNACDICMTTAAGEGWGLPSMESAVVGVPSVVLDIGGHKEFLNSGNSVMIQPVMENYVDASVDQIGGLSQYGNPKDFAEAMWKLYQNPAQVRKLGKQARIDMVQHFDWDIMADRLYSIINKIRDK